MQDRLKIVHHNADLKSQDEQLMIYALKNFKIRHDNVYNHTLLCVLDKVAAISVIPQNFVTKSEMNKFSCRNFKIHKAQTVIPINTKCRVSFKMQSINVEYHSITPYVLHLAVFTLLSHSAFVALREIKLIFS